MSCQILVVRYIFAHFPIDTIVETELRCKILSKCSVECSAVHGLFYNQNEKYCCHILFWFIFGEEHN